jgi:hypothetical protein
LKLYLIIASCPFDKGQPLHALRADHIAFSHRLPGIGLGRLTVGAVTIVNLKQAIAQVGGQVAHRLQLVCRGNPVPTPLKQGSSDAQLDPTMPKRGVVVHLLAPDPLRSAHQCSEPHEQDRA